MKKLFFVACTLLWAFAFGAPLEISKLTTNAYLYTTYNTFDGQLFPSNSMYVVTNDGIVLLDTPWDSAQFQPLLDSIQIRHNKPVVLCIATHFHSDRTAGLEYFSSKGIPTWSSRFTRDLCAEHGEKRAANVFLQDTTFNLGEYSFETFYPGAGHAPDNIVIWIPELKILYGGCFIKSVETKSLGNLSDASTADWEVSIQKTLDKYPDPALIIPGHFGLSKKNALVHTLKLLQKHAKHGKS